MIAAQARSRHARSARYSGQFSSTVPHSGHLPLTFPVRSKPQRLHLPGCSRFTSSGVRKGRSSGGAGGTPVPLHAEHFPLIKTHRRTAATKTPSARNSTPKDAMVINTTSEKVFGVTRSGLGNTLQNAIRTTVRSANAKWIMRRRLPEPWQALQTRADGGVLISSSVGVPRRLVQSRRGHMASRAREGFALRFDVGASLH
jgi:hypothetical protein